VLIGHRNTYKKINKGGVGAPIRSHYVTYRGGSFLLAQFLPCAGLGEKAKTVTVKGYRRVGRGELAAKHLGFWRFAACGAVFLYLPSLHQ
jgi:hypothetical protein